MKIILTAIGFLIIQEVTPDGGKELTHIMLDEVVAVKTHKFEEGGEAEFYMRNGLSDSLGWKPISIQCYNDADYIKLYNAIYSRLEE